MLMLIVAKSMNIPGLCSWLCVFLTHEQMYALKSTDCAGWKYSLRLLSGYMLEPKVCSVS